MMKWPSKSTFKFLLSEYDNILFCMLHTAFIILISHDSREPFPMRPTACRVSSPMFFSFAFFHSHTIYNHGAFPWLHGKNEHSVKFESRQPSIGQRASRNSTATSKAVLPTMQPRYHTKIPSINGKFYKDIRDIFLESRKKCYVPCFSTYLMPTR